MTLLRRAGLSKPRPERSLEAARDVGADGFCLKKDIVRNYSTHKTFFILKVGYAKNWSSEMLELIGFVCKWIFWETNLYNNLIIIKTIETNDT